jgi:RHS repeat-associated protein
MKKKFLVTSLSLLLALTIVFQVFPEVTLKAQELLETESTVTEAITQVNADILYEIEDRREEAVKHFQMSDGSVMAALYSDVVHKEAENGKLVDIDNTLNDNGDAYKNTDGIFDVSFFKKPKSNKMVEINYNGYEISFGIEKIKSSEAKIKNGAKNNKSSLTQTSSQARYDNAFDGIDLVYDLTGAKIKESIVINEYTGINSFTFTYRFGILTPVLNEDGSIDLFDNEKKVLEIQAPFMFDALGAESDAVEVTLQKHGSKYEYTLTASEEWLTAEDRAYPVIIDPTLETGVENSKIYDTYINPQSPGTSHYRPQSGKLLIGTSNGGGEYTTTFEGYRTYIWFEMPQHIPNGSRISNATLTLYCHDDEWDNYRDIDTNTSIELYELYPGTQHASDICWNNKDTLVSVKSEPTDYQCLRAGVLSPTNYCYKWNITSLIDSYYETKNSDEIPQNYAPGMMLRYKDESVTDNDFYAGFHSGNSSEDYCFPSITISYTDTKGIEDYYDYFASSLDDSGASYVNAFNGGLNYVNTVLSESGTRLPASVSVYYNSAVNAWNFSFNQNITHTPETDEAKEYYSFTDADGTVHYFRKYGEKFLDETGSGLVLTNNGATITLSYEDRIGRSIFTCINSDAEEKNKVWYISSVEDGLNNTQTYNRNGSKLTSIVDGAGRTITVNYTNNRVTSVTDAAGRSTVFTYDGTKLKNITYINGKTVSFAYTDNLLTTITASTDARVEYVYDQCGRVTEIHEYDRAEENINNYTVSYEHKNATRITDKHGDELFYQFDFYGKTVSVTDNHGNAIYNAFSNMTPEATPENYYLRNKLLVQSSLQSNVINMLENNSAERGTANWSSVSGTFATDSDEFLGFNSFKVVSGEARQSVTVKSGTTYTFSSYLRAEAGNSASLKLSGASATVTGESITTNGEWERHSITATATADGTLYASIIAEGTAYFDLLQLETGEAMNRINLLSNGDFSKGLTNWTKSTGASSYTDTVTGSNSDIITQGTNKVVKMTGDHTSNVYAYQNVYLNAPDTGSLVVSGWAKADAAPDNEEYNEGKWFGMYVELTYADTNQTKKVIPVEFNTAVKIENRSTYAPWQYVCAAVPLDSDYASHLNVLSAKVYLCYNKNINTAYFDNIQLFYEEFGNTYSYDQMGNVVTAVDKASQQTNFTNSGNDVSSVSNPDGTGFEYHYQKADYPYNNLKKCLSSYKTSDGVAGKYTYNAYGSATGSTVFSDGYSESIRDDQAYLVMHNGFALTAAYNTENGYDFPCLDTCNFNDTFQTVNLQKTEDGYYKLSTILGYLEKNEYSSEVYIREKNYGIGQSWEIVPSDEGGYLIRSASDPIPNDSGAWYLTYDYKTGCCMCEYSSDSSAASWNFYALEFVDAGGIYVAHNPMPQSGKTYNIVSLGEGLPVNSEYGTLETAYYSANSTEQDFYIENAGNGYVYILCEGKIGGSEQRYLFKNIYGSVEIGYGDYTQEPAAKFLIEGEYQKTIKAYDGAYLYSGALNNVFCDANGSDATNKYWLFFESSKKITTSADYSADYNYNYLTSQTDALGNTVTYTYNFQTGTMTTATDAKGNVTSYTYNNSDQLTSVSQGGVSVNYTYDENNQLSSIAHNGFNYIFTYDALGRSKTTSVGNRTLVTNLYDEVTGLLDTATYGNGDTRKYTYDDQQRVIKLTIDGIDRFSYVYDSRGNIHSATDLVQDITYKYLYDFVGRPVQVRTSQGFVIKITYDEFNRASNVKFGFGSDTLTTEWRYGETNIYDLSQKSGVIYGVSYNGTEKLTYKYDNLGRRTSTTLNTITPFVISYGFKDVNYKNTSTQLSYISYSNGTAYNYTYDANGNITSITDPAGANIASYTYDALNQLVREDNAQLNKTITYTYDNGGNILAVNEYAYNNLSQHISTKTYTYGDTNWRDLLTNYNGVNISYDAIGNPLNWINGETFSWSGGRQLTGVTKNSNTISYAYDDNGIRTSKTINGIRTDYYLNGTTIVMQKTGDNVIWYTYDENGLATGFRYNGAEYYYFRNGQNDIIGIVDSSGTTVAQYTYDSWGKHISITDGNGNNVSGNANHIANINPLRYRGYYFDTETGLYYLQSRYYDANVGRFLNCDSVVSGTGESAKGYNLFEYCFNNPINMTDEGGEWPNFLKKAVKWVAKEVVKPIVKSIQNALADVDLTLSLGFNISGTPSGFIFNGQIGVSMDTKGNIAIQHTVGGGVATGTPGISGTVYASITNAPDISKLEGPYAQVGASAAGGGLAVAGDVMIIPDSENDTSYFGATFNGGFGTPGAEFHVEWGETETIEATSFNIFDFARDIYIKIMEW